MYLRLIIRDAWTIDESRVVVCSEAMMKPKQRGLQVAVERAARHRWRYLNDKRNGSLRILEER